MFGAKPHASLSSGLLARKGQARPAMRPQGFSMVPPDAAALEDLGWNDMGTAEPAPLPPVLEERAALKQEVEAPAPTPPEAAPTPLAPEATRALVAAARGRTGKAAFTLRLDPARHLRLRLASAVGDRSAQRIVMEALDVFLAGVPGLDDLVAQAGEPESR